MRCSHSAVICCGVIGFVAPQTKSIAQSGQSELSFTGTLSAGHTGTESKGSGANRSSNGVETALTSTPYTAYTRASNTDSLHDYFWEAYGQYPIVVAAFAAGINMQFFPSRHFSLLSRLHLNNRRGSEEVDNSG